MKTFKEHIQEKWFNSIKSNWADNSTDIFFNPTKKEIKEIDHDAFYSKEFNEGFRAFLLDSGDMYAWSQALHDDVYRKYGSKIGNAFIAITCNVIGNSIDIKIASFTRELRTNEYAIMSIKEITENIKNHRQLKRNFNSIKIVSGGFYS